ncbi:UNVERIFIED_CONTAM: hypothetical protein Sradi_3618400 [Sesamum radiatum]|uniref:Uncharacterized protein n=1 Tax=Sesamum radiatum TaxID=300843 RepID=A0AAW2QJ48_SESRA
MGIVRSFGGGSYGMGFEALMRRHLRTVGRIRDFNAVLDASESCGRSAENTNAMTEFREWKIKGDLALNVRLAKSYLDSAQTLFETYREDIFLHLVQWCRIVYCKAVELEASMLRQRAKMTWLTKGDQCSKFFFSKINARRAMQRVYQIQNSDGQLVSGSEQVAAEFVSFFQALLGGTSRRGLLIWIFLSNIVDEANTLLLPITHTEIKAAFFDISEESAPGPDGYTSAFFKAAWPEIGNEVVRQSQNSLFQAGF